MVERIDTRPDLPSLYRTMCRIRFVEEASAQLWREGLVSGELHSGTDEEAVAAGVVAHLRSGDALAVDHRCTPAFVARGVEPLAILRELLGDPEGLDGGCAGHMHLMAPGHRIAASGIVGSTGPVACGFALAAQQAAAGDIAVAFFGDGAVNEGMLMEAFNLASAWRLPVLFVCKDNRWAVNTRSGSVTGGNLRRRAAGFGLPVLSADGRDVTAVWRSAKRAVRQVRRGRPVFLLVRVGRSDGHFLGDRLLALTRDRRALNAELGPMVRALREAGGAPTTARLHAVERLGMTIGTLRADRLRCDPLARTRARLHPATAELVEEDTRAEISDAVRLARPGAEAAHA